MKFRSLLAIAAALPLLAAAPAPVVAKPLPAELQTALRCGALFALVSADQVRGAPGVADWPVLGSRGREFFVRIAARAMDASMLDRPGIEALARAEVTALRQGGGASGAQGRALKVPCLAMLDAVVPPALLPRPR